MPSADSTEAARPPSPAGPPSASRHGNLVLASAILATVAALIAAAYGVAKDIFVLRTLAWNTVLAAQAAWLCVNVHRLHGRAAAAEQNREIDPPADTVKSRFLRWEGGGGEAAEAEVAIGSWISSMRRSFISCFWRWFRPPRSCFWQLAHSGFRGHKRRSPFPRGRPPPWRLSAWQDRVCG